MKTLTRLAGFMVAWLMFMVAAVQHVPAEAVDRSRLDAGETLAPGDDLVSTDGLHTLTMEVDGDLVLRSGDEVVWSAGTTVPGSTLVAQADGNVVVQAPGGAPQWATGTHGGGPTRLEVHEGGGARVHDGGGAELWEVASPVG
jgi:hypothetical protein